MTLPHTLPPSADGQFSAPPSLLNNRWFQLSAGILGMIAVANFQYAWTLFEIPLEQRHGWGKVALGDAFTIFLLAQTWLVPLEGYLADRFGPRRLLVCGGALAALAWVILAHTESLTVLYAVQILSGCGAGIVYGISMGSALKWFPDRRGLAAGLTAAAFGTGSALTIVPIGMTIKYAGYESAFLWFGLGQGLVIVLAGLVLRFPRSDEIVELPRTPVLQSTRDYAPTAVLRAPAFWLLYGMMTMGAIPGLLMTGKMARMAADFGVDEMLVLGVNALYLALMIDRLMGGLTRPFFGWISDRIGRELAMFVAFAFEGGALLLLILFYDHPGMFVLMSGIAFFGWGAVFSLFPAAAADLFGRKFATTNNGLLYTAKGMASLLLLLIYRLQANTGSWVPVFVVMIAADWIAALLALFALRPLRARAAAMETAAFRQKADAYFAQHMKQGRSALDARRFDDAIRAFEDALKLAPDNAEARLALAQAREGQV
jgi:OFA family oxalate/formate antiporter-like MFS transporter